MDMHLIWVRRERKYFCKKGWTGKPAKHELICPSGKINGHVGWVEPFAKPITGQKVMGIASAFTLRATAEDGRRNRLFIVGGHRITFLRTR